MRKKNKLEKMRFYFYVTKYGQIISYEKYHTNIGILYLREDLLVKKPFEYYHKAQYYRNKYFKVTKQKDLKNEITR